MRDSNPDLQRWHLQNTKKMHKFAHLLICYQTWLGERELFQSPDEEVKCDVEQIQDLLKDGAHTQRTKGKHVKTLYR